MTKVWVRARQSYPDLSIQLSGTLENLFEIIEDGHSITDELAPGEELVVKNDFDTVDRLVLEGYRKSGDIPATGLKDFGSEDIQPGGIGYMQIGVDFKVS